MRSERKVRPRRRRPTRTCEKYQFPFCFPCCWCLVSHCDGAQGLEIERRNVRTPCVVSKAHSANRSPCCTASCVPLRCTALLCAAWPSLIHIAHPSRLAPVRLLRLRSPAARALHQCAGKGHVVALAGQVRSTRDNPAIRCRAISTVTFSACVEVERSPGSMRAAPRSVHVHALQFNIGYLRQYYRMLRLPGTLCAPVGEGVSQRPRAESVRVVACPIQTL